MQKCYFYEKYLYRKHYVDFEIKIITEDVQHMNQVIHLLLKNGLF